MTTGHLAGVRLADGSGWVAIGDTLIEGHTRSRVSIEQGAAAGVITLCLARPWSGPWTTRPPPGGPPSSGTTAMGSTAWATASSRWVAAAWRAGVAARVAGQQRALRRGGALVS